MTAVVAADLTCFICGNGFYARSDAVYCSPACRQKAHRARLARRTKPNVAGSAQRAQQALDRARALCRAAADHLEQAAATQQEIIQRYAIGAATTPPLEQIESAISDTATERAP